jgi:hypothetical protein
MECSPYLRNPPLTTREREMLKVLKRLVEEHDRLTAFRAKSGAPPALTNEAMGWARNTIATVEGREAPEPRWGLPQ